MSHVQLTLAPNTIVLLGILLPAAVALVTKRYADSWVKAVTLLALAALMALVDVIRDNAGIVSGQMFWDTLFLFLDAVGLHFGLLQPTRITGSNGVIQRAVPQGIGSGPEAPAVRPVP